MYGTVRTVVWEDGGGNPASYPIADIRHNEHHSARLLVLGQQGTEISGPVQNAHDFNLIVTGSVENQPLLMAADAPGAHTLELRIQILTDAPGVVGRFIRVCSTAARNRALGASDSIGGSRPNQGAA